MARPKNTLRTIQVNLAIPEDLVARMELSLFSEVEGKIPHGARSELIARLLREHFTKVGFVCGTTWSEIV